MTFVDDPFYQPGETGPGGGYMPPAEPPIVPGPFRMPPEHLKDQHWNPAVGDWVPGPSPTLAAKRGLAPAPAAATDAGVDDWIVPGASKQQAKAPETGVDDWIVPPGAQMPGILEATGQGLAHGVRSIGQTAQAVTGEQPEPQAPSPAAAPLQWSDVTSPASVLAPKIAYRLAESAPTLAGGIAGGIGGGAAGTAVAGPPGTLVGAIGGGAAGAAAVSAAQTLGPYYAQALKETPDDPEGAFDRAMKAAAVSGAFGAASWAAFPLRFFQGPVKNLMFQAFGVQPGLAVGHKATQNVMEGKPATEDVGQAYAEGTVMTVVPMTGHAAVSKALKAARPGEPSAPPPDTAGKIDEILAPPRAEPAAAPPPARAVEPEAVPTPSAEVRDLPVPEPTPAPKAAVEPRQELPPERTISAESSEVALPKAIEPLPAPTPPTEPSARFGDQGPAGDVTSNAALGRPMEIRQEQAKPAIEPARSDVDGVPVDFPDIDHQAIFELGRRLDERGGKIGKGEVEEARRLLERFKGYIITDDNAPWRSVKDVRDAALDYYRDAAERSRGPQGQDGRTVEAQSMIEPDLVMDWYRRAIREGQVPSRPTVTPTPVETRSPDIVGLSPEALAVDAARFQYKGGADESGVTGALKGVERWDERLANPILVWEAADGKRYVVNGHQRTDLARRAQAAGQVDVQIPARILREADGFTPEYMRALGAYQNIAEGTGTAVDAAKVLRVNRDGLPDLPPRSQLVQDAKALASLSDDAFGMVANGIVPEAHGAQVGRILKDPAEQVAAMDVLAKTQPANADQARIIVEDIRNAGFLKGEQSTLFGDEQLAHSLVAERARILDRAIKTLRKTGTAFKTAVEQEGTLTEAGNVLSREANVKAQTDNERLAEILRTDGTRKGPISDELSAAARALADGKNIGVVTSTYLAKVRSLAGGKPEGAQSRPAADRDGSPGPQEKRFGFAEGREGEQRPLSSEYQAARETHDAASGTFNKVRDDYRARKVGDAEFLAARKVMDAADKEFDTAFAKEQKRKPATETVVLDKGKRGEQFVIPGAERESQGTQAQRKSDAPLRPKKEQKDTDGLPLFGDKQGSLFEPTRSFLRDEHGSVDVGKISDALREKAETVLDPLKDVVRDLQIKATPMAARDATIEARATAKDFANAMRLAQWQWARIDQQLVKDFKPEQLERMWKAADAESVARQEGHDAGVDGLAGLPANERAAVKRLQDAADAVWKQAQDLGMVEGEGLPSYVPRMVIDMATGERPKGGGEGPRSLGTMGSNLRTTTAQMRLRKYLTAAGTEAAAQSKFGEGAQVIRDIRTLPLATSTMQEAVAGRTLINKIKEIGKVTGSETVVEGAEPGGSPHKWFTIDHPAFKTWRPKFRENTDTGKTEAVRDQSGETVFEKVPLYVRSDFEGPLKSVLSNDAGKIYNAVMDLKGKAMSVIMYSPLIHNAVEWGRALPAMPGKVATFKIYFEGNQAKNDPAVMKEAIRDGLVPIGHRAFNQDITSIMEGPNVKPGRSWTAQLAAAVPGLFDKRAGDAVKRTVDKMGNFWHNTLLWDRVADLQMGLYKNIRDDLTARGTDPQTASRTAAHLANRYAGALPIEAMSDMARKIANVTMFSRSFTLGNIGAMKDMLVGLPRDVQAQIARDKGFEALAGIKNYAKRKAIAIVALDIALMYAANSALQDGVRYLAGDQDLSDIARGYVDRLGRAMARVKEHPFEALNPFHMAESLSSTSENEPGKKDRILVGYQKDGTAIYGRNPAGKIGEEFIGYLTQPLDMLRRKQSTIARPTYQTLANDQGFGRKVYDPYAETPKEWIKNIGRIMWLYMSAQTPADQIAAARDLAKGEGDAKTNTLKVLGPLAGVTFSKGAPGGPAMGELYRAEEKHRMAVQRELPELRKKVQAGDLEGASERMTELGIPVGLQRFYIRTSLDPATRMSGRKLRDFELYATEEERARMARQQDRLSK